MKMQSSLDCLMMDIAEVHTSLNRVAAHFLAPLALGLVLTACGGSSSTVAPVQVATNLVATSVRQAAPSTACPYGGIVVEGGIDSNGNKVLDPSEVTSTQTVCNGAPGANGATGPTGASGASGSNGTNGTNGLTTLVLVTGEPAGVNCPNGGNKILAGLDANGNSVLDANEVSTTAYVCTGANGTNGTNGVNGATGANGLNSLVSITPEPAGVFCQYGGSKVMSGVDSNANGILDAAEVTASSYACNGAPGANGTNGTNGATGATGPGITWVNVTGTTAQAAPNKGYLANNAALVTITLPSTGVLGDIVQVSGIGAGGWKIAQNAGQSIITNGVMGNSGSEWMARDTARNWQSVASSGNGSKLVASAYGGQLYTSTDSGITWTARDAVRNWFGVASSADGSKLVAAVNSGQLYTSNDSGVTWTARDAVRGWYGVASSADGSKLVAGTIGGQIYTSTDSGVSWTARDAARIWYGVASSADGSKLVAASSGGQLYTSTDSGATWTARDVNRIWYAVASSADGSKLVASDFGGQLYTSSDSGVTWTARNANSIWRGVASSADGNKLVAAANGGQLYTSSDAGVTWVARGAVSNWFGVASSADGSKLVAAANSGQLYTSGPTLTPLSTTAGILGFMDGGQYDSVDLQCIDPNTYLVRGYVGSLTVN